MRHWTPAAIIVVLATAAPAAYSAPATAQSSAVIATVDGVAVFKAEFDRDLVRLKRDHTARFGTDFASAAGKHVEADLKRQLVAASVGRRVVLNEVARRRIDVAPAEVEAEIEQMASQARSPKAFQDLLASAALTLPELRHRTYYQLAVTILAEQVSAGVKVTEAELQAYYRQAPHLFDRPEQVRVRHLMVRDEAKANRLLAELTGGADFATTAMIHSEDTTTKGIGGDRGFIARGDTGPDFEAAAFTLQPGELSGVLRLGTEYHILQGVDRRPARKLTFAEARADLEDSLLQHAKDQAFDTWLRGAEARAKVVYSRGYAPTPVPGKK